VNCSKKGIPDPAVRYAFCIWQNAPSYLEPAAKMVDFSVVALALMQSRKPMVLES